MLKGEVEYKKIRRKKKKKKPINWNPYSRSTQGTMVESRQFKNRSKKEKKRKEIVMELLPLSV